METIPIDYRTRLPITLRALREGNLGILSILHGKDPNSLDDQTLAGLTRYFENLTVDVTAIVITYEGPAFPDQDVTKFTKSDPSAALERSRGLNNVLNQIQFCKVPVIAVLQGSVFGSKLHMAACAHVRVAERCAFYALPNDGFLEFFSPTGWMRLQSLFGTTRITDMALTGRTYSAEEAHQLGFSTYLVANGTGLAKARELGTALSVRH